MKKMITRTIKTMDVKVRYANLEANAIEEMDVTIPYVKSGSQVERKATETLPAGRKFLSAEVTAVKETVYGMDELEFLRTATPVIRGNNGTAKPIMHDNPEDATEEGGDSHGQCSEPDAIAEKKARKLNMVRQL